MRVGKKIKIIRQFRNMTQKQLADDLNLGEKGANRIAQYEMGYRVPKKAMLDDVAKILHVNPLSLYDPDDDTAEGILWTLFWLDESAGSVNLFPMDHYHVGGAGRRSKKATLLAEALPADNIVRYHNNDTWPAHPPVGMWFNYGLLNTFLDDWRRKKEELLSGEITREEYFEWKLNWPHV